MAYLNATMIVQYATMAGFVMNDPGGVYVHLDLKETTAQQVIINQAISCGEILSMFYSKHVTRWMSHLGLPSCPASAINYSVGLCSIHAKANSQC